MAPITQEWIRHVLLINDWWLHLLWLENLFQFLADKDHLHRNANLNTDVMYLSSNRICYFNYFWKADRSYIAAVSPLVLLENKWNVTYKSAGGRILMWAIGYWRSLEVRLVEDGACAWWIIVFHKQSQWQQSIFGFENVTVSQG